MVAILSGANVNFDRLRYISEVAEIGEGREVILAVTLPEQPGSFARFCSLIGKRPITEFNYRYSDASSAQIYVGIKVSGEPGARQALLDELKSRAVPRARYYRRRTGQIPYPPYGGWPTPASVNDERVYRFEFPERPGALLNFLRKLGKQFNISLFHYRNHGAAFGRVLVGLQVAEDKQEQLQNTLQEVGYAR